MNVHGWYEPPSNVSNLMAEALTAAMREAVTVISSSSAELTVIFPEAQRAFGNEFIKVFKASRATRLVQVFVEVHQEVHPKDWDTYTPVFWSLIQDDGGDIRPERYGEMLDRLVRKAQATQRCEERFRKRKVTSVTPFSKSTKLTREVIRAQLDMMFTPVKRELGIPILMLVHSAR
ncbi:MAG: hypothetical protein ABII02_02460 [Candidatus Magasanikbacteria bacterium]